MLQQQPRSTEPPSGHCGDERGALAGSDTVRCHAIDRRAACERRFDSVLVAIRRCRDEPPLICCHKLCGTASVRRWRRRRRWWWPWLSLRLRLLLLMRLRLRRPLRLPLMSRFLL
jgi:hypothetical protein